MASGTPGYAYLEQSLGIDGRDCRPFSDGGLAVRIQYVNGTGSQEEAWGGEFSDTETYKIGTPNEDVHRYDAATHAVGVEFAAPSYELDAPAAGTYVRTPANSSDIIGQTGNPTYVGEDGLHGSGVVSPTSATGSLTDNENKSWWEGLFGSITGALGSIWAKLQEMSNTLTSTLSKITSLPGDIVSAFTDALTPTVGVQARITALADVAETKAPIAWYGETTDALDGLLSAAPAGCAELAIPTSELAASSGWPNPVEVELCIPAGVSAITLPISRLVGWALLVLYAISRIHGFLNGGMKEGTQMRLFE